MLACRIECRISKKSPTKATSSFSHIKPNFRHADHGIVRPEAYKKRTERSTGGSGHELCHSMPQTIFRIDSFRGEAGGSCVIGV